MISYSRGIDFKFVQKLIDDLEVLCLRGNGKCQWQGASSNLNYHQQKCAGLGQELLIDIVISNKTKQEEKKEIFNWLDIIDED